MGEITKYFVPVDEAPLLERERELAEAFWALGIFVVTSDRFVYERIKLWEAQGRSLPEWKHSFSFVEMGFGGSHLFEPVPGMIYDLLCPLCHTDIGNAAYEVWEEDSEIILPERLIGCPTCNREVRSDTLVTEETPFTFSRFYLWVADIEESDWDNTFKATVESVLGPCREFTAWET
jgi:hypothetical protein